MSLCVAAGDLGKRKFIDLTVEEEEEKEVEDKDVIDLTGDDDDSVVRTATHFFDSFPNLMNEQTDCEEARKDYYEVMKAFELAYYNGYYALLKQPVNEIVKTHIGPQLLKYLQSFDGRANFSYDTKTPLLDMSFMPPKKRGGKTLHVHLWEKVFSELAKRARMNCGLSEAPDLSELMEEFDNDLFKDPGLAKDKRLENWAYVTNYS
jgi:hypothetical protein